MVLAVDNCLWTATFGAAPGSAIFNGFTAPSSCQDHHGHENTSTDLRLYIISAPKCLPAM